LPRRRARQDPIEIGGARLQQMILFRIPNLLAVAAATVALLAGPASAQLARNSDAPVDITADELEVLNTQCLSIWRGSAEALQDQSRLRADVLKTFFQVTGSTRTASASSAKIGRAHV